MRENKGFLSLMRSILMTGVTLYLVDAQSRDVAGVFSTAGRPLDDVKHYSEENGKKAARAINSLDALFEEV